jgi:hypothetical protein
MCMHLVFLVFRNARLNMCECCCKCVYIIYIHTRFECVCVCVCESVSSKSRVLTCARVCVGVCVGVCVCVCVHYCVLGVKSMDIFERNGGSDNFNAHELKKARTQDLIYGAW